MRNIDNDCFAEAMENMRIVERRDKIMRWNNSCVIETVAFYEHVLWDDIIIPFSFSPRDSGNSDIRSIIGEKLSLMDKFKIVCKIAKTGGVSNFKQFDDYIEMRNRVAHNYLFSVFRIDPETKESQISFAGQTTSWNQYLEELGRWAEMSRNMAEFSLKVFKIANNKSAFFPYCKVEGRCIMVQHVLRYPEPEGEYTSFFKRGLTLDLLDYINEEQKYIAMDGSHE